MNISIDISKSDATVLVYCMDIMKKNASDQLRRNLGKRDGKKQMKIYKSVLKYLEEELTMIDEDAEENHVMKVEFSPEQSEMVREFIQSFTLLIVEKAKSEDKEAEGEQFYKPIQNIMFALLIAESDAMAIA